MPKRHKCALIAELNLIFSSRSSARKRFGMEINMIIYLTSDPGTTYIEGKIGLNDDNRFIENLKTLIIMYKAVMQLR